MSLCPLHHIFYTTYCPTCRQDAIKAWRASEKAKKQPTVKKYTQSNPIRDRLKTRLQYAWRSIIYPYYQERGLTSRCWICERAIYERSGTLFSGHVSHYYPKSKYWQLWTDPVNSGICCYSCNVAHPESVPAMQTKMIQVWGSEAVQALHQRQQAYDLRIKTSIDPRYPTTEWLQAMIKETKNMKL